jgi:hypothetical protein
VAINLNRPEARTFVSPVASRTSVFLHARECEVLEASDGVKHEDMEKHKERWDDLWNQSQHKKEVTDFLKNI